MNWVYVCMYPGSMLDVHLHAGSKSNAPTVANTQKRKRFYFVRRQEKETTINHVPQLSISGRAPTAPAKTQRNKDTGVGEKERNSSLNWQHWIVA